MDANSERYQQARRHVRALRDFYIHLTVYVLVNLGLFLINLLTSPGHWWFYWPLLGWGIAVAVHGATVLGTDRWLGPEWEEREIRKLMAREESRR